MNFGSDVFNELISIKENPDVVSDLVSVKISADVLHEFALMAIGVYIGIILILFYDVIKILKNLLKLKAVKEIIADTLFWVIASLYVYDTLLRYNYGGVRMFVIVIILVTMLAFEVLIGRRITKALTNILRKIVITLLKPLKKPIKVIKLKERAFRVRCMKCRINAKKSIRKKVKKCHRHNSAEDLQTRNAAELRQHKTEEPERMPELHVDYTILDSEDYRGAE